MGNSFNTTCKDYTTKDGKSIKGCGANIQIKRASEADPWHPYNLDGSEHKHAGHKQDVKVVEKVVEKTVVQQPLIAADEVIRIIARQEAEKVYAEHNAAK